MLITVTKLYSRLHEFIHENFQINIPSLGFLLRQIKKDFLADIIAVNDDPTKNISTMENVVFVMKNGIVYKK